MADSKPLPGQDQPAPAGEPDEGDASRVRAAIGEGLRKFYDTVAEEPIPAEWLALVGGKPDEPST
ncbi:MAG TPA: NepR family anti-sigma factor [Caulobacterales bacterium]|nr:NepR family anti-sigma factor [Caulobacterales bacterium]